MANAKNEQDPKDPDVVGPAAEGEPEPDQPKASELKKADAVSGPDVSDAEPNDPPVRTDRPDVPVVSVLAEGAGAHTPPDPDKIGPDGRPV